MNNNKIIFLVLCSFLLVSNVGFAAPKLKKVTSEERRKAREVGKSRIRVVPEKTGRLDSPPQKMLKSVTDKMLHELRKHVGNLKNNDALVYNLVNKVLVPHFDLNKMSRFVVGRSWNKSPKSVQKQFIHEFKHYVINTYSAALQSYDGSKVGIKYQPLRVRGPIGKKVAVSSSLQLQNGRSVQLKYRLELHGKKWLVYDFSVDGVSIVKNYQSQFGPVLRQKGLKGLVAQLRQRNSKKG